MNDWLIVNDGVMGGLSKSRFVLSDGNTAQVNFNWRFNGLKLISRRVYLPGRDVQAGAFVYFFVLS